MITKIIELVNGADRNGNGAVRLTRSFKWFARGEKMIARVIMCLQRILHRRRFYLLERAASSLGRLASQPIPNRQEIVSKGFKMLSVLREDGHAQRAHGGRGYLKELALNTRAVQHPSQKFLNRIGSHC